MSSLATEVEGYLLDFPYQETFKYLVAYTQGDPSRLNSWVVGEQPVLVKAGEDTVVRMNNDTFYKIAFLVLDQGPVILRSDTPAVDRFVSIQLGDDRNVNYRNVVHPSGAYTIYHGEPPADVVGEPIKAPSAIGSVGIRVEVRDKKDPADVEAAEEVFRGISIEGPVIETLPAVDRLSGYTTEVADEANRLMDETIRQVPFRELVVGPGQEPGTDVPYLNHAAGTKAGFGGPAPEHSSYEVIFDDTKGDPLIGAQGPYTITTQPPPVKAFWSVTVYDTERGGFFHPNPDDRYHINDTVAAPNADGTVTFTFAAECTGERPNCLEVPDGQFDMVARYYLPDQQIINGDWHIPKPHKE